jgi:hypothetical protein
VTEIDIDIDIIIALVLVAVGLFSNNPLYCIAGGLCSIASGVEIHIENTRK